MKVDIASFRLPRYREIPDVGLYLDQTVKYINRFLQPLGCVEITASMVSNYVKKGYIRNPDHKQYDAEQIARLMIIAIAKMVLPMENIARLFRMQGEYSNQRAYDYFCDELEKLLGYIFGLETPEGEAPAAESGANDGKAMLTATIIAVAYIIFLNSQFESHQEAAIAAPEKASAPVQAQ